MNFDPVAFGKETERQSAHADMKWKGTGYCLARHQREHGDHCNTPTIMGGLYCSHHTCIVRRCHRKASSWFPLMPDEPHFCSKHYDRRQEWGCE